MSELMENHINDLELQIAQLETAVRCYVVNIDIQKQKNKILQNKINKAIEKYKNCKEEDYCTLALDMYDILKSEDKPQYLGYSDKECINCGRLRVEKYSDGTEICEKCNFGQNKKEYVLRGKDNE